MIRSVNRLFVGQALTHHALNGLDGTLNVLHAQGRPLAVPEVEFAQVALQMRGADVVIHAIDAALEDREIALDRIRVRVPTNVLFNAVVDRVVPRKVWSDDAILAFAIRHQGGLLIKLCLKDWLQRLGRHVRHMPRLHLAAALYQREHGFLANAADDLRVALALVPVLLLAANEGFVRFRNLAFAAHRCGVQFPHAFADAVAHKPTGLVRQAEHPAQLVCGHPLLAAAQQMRGQKPLRQGDVRPLVNRANRRRELPAARAA